MGKKDPLTCRLLPTAASNGLNSGPILMEGRKLNPNSSRLRFRKPGQKPGLLFFALLLILFYGCQLGSDPGEPSPTAPEVQPATLTPELLPDLTVVSTKLQPRQDVPCPTSVDQFVLRVVIANYGAATAGDFIVSSVEENQMINAGLGPGRALTIWFEKFSPREEIQVDAHNQVRENNESNNIQTTTLTLPAVAKDCQSAQEIPVTRLEPAGELANHTGAVKSVSFAPGGGFLASASSDNTLRLWRVRQQTLLRTMYGHPFPVLSVAFSPDGLQLATGSDDSLVRVWNVSNAALIAEFAGHAGWVTCVAYSPNGNQLVSGSNDFTVRLWRLVDGREIRLFDEGFGRIEDLAFHPDGTALAWVEDSGTVRVWSLTENRWSHIFHSSSGGTFSLELGPQGSWLAAGTGDGQIHFWDLILGEHLLTLDGHSGAVTALAVSQDGRWLASGDTHNQIRFWSLPPKLDPGINLETAYIGVGHEGAINSLAFSPVTTLAASGGEDGLILFWDLSPESLE